jgi:L-fuconolactonase
VVGWAQLDSAQLPQHLSHFEARAGLVGLREIVQAKADGYLDRTDFDRGIEQLTSRALIYDVLIRERQLEEVIRLVDRHPQQAFVLDHAAKPKIAAGELEPWSTHIRDLARRPNVSCKLSGLVTEANWATWTQENLRPYLDVCVEAFGPQRMLAGSDWPVCLLATSYAQWWELLMSYFNAFSPAEAELIFGGNAMTIYGLQGESEASSEHRS